MDQKNLKESVTVTSNYVHINPLSKHMHHSKKKEKKTKKKLCLTIKMLTSKSKIASIKNIKDMVFKIFLNTIPQNKTVNFFRKKERRFLL
jgi:hypothetical protein